MHSVLLNYDSYSFFTELWLDLTSVLSKVYTQPLISGREFNLIRLSLAHLASLSFILCHGVGYQGSVICTFQMTIMLRSNSLHFLTMLVMLEALSSVMPWLLLDEVLDDATSTRWDSGVRQPRNKKSPQGVEELMICTEIVARGEGKAKVSRHREQKIHSKNT